LQLFLAHPEVKKSKLVLVYFKSKTYDEESKDAIENLSAFMEGKQTRTPQAARLTGNIDHRPMPAESKT